mmetsp:Transcript_34894/g.76947  ORF Transcript_34894/g.76947 Transcript_34894/m.76947 type:complete len:128 (-) Transcript_34894:46-429(-)
MDGGMDRGGGGGMDVDEVEMQGTGTHVNLGMQGQGQVKNLGMGQGQGAGVREAMGGVDVPELTFSQYYYRPTTVRSDRSDSMTGETDTEVRSPCTLPHSSSVNSLENAGLNLYAEGIAESRKANFAV